jgi:hypothetical protein
MALVCPSCERIGSLRIVSWIALPPDSRSDEITLQVLACSRCDFTGVAVYEESRRGALDHESFRHIGYDVQPDTVVRIRHLINACPDRKNPRCQCASHRGLSSRNQFGRWDFLDDLDYSGTFTMRFR